MLKFIAAIAAAIVICSCTASASFAQCTFEQGALSEPGREWSRVRCTLSLRGGQSVGLAIGLADNDDVADLPLCATSGHGLLQGEWLISNTPEEPVRIKEGGICEFIALGSAGHREVEVSFQLDLRSTDRDNDNDADCARQSVQITGQGLLMEELGRITLLRDFATGSPIAGIYFGQENRSELLRTLGMATP